MKGSSLFIILLLISFKLLSQDLLFEQNITLKSVFKDKRESLPIVNNDKNEIVLFLMDNKKINCLLINKDFELIDNFTTNRPENKFKVLLGYSADSMSYHMFFTNDKKSKFYLKTMNFSQKKSDGILLALKLKDEKFLESISYKNKFYLITIKKRSSIMNIYEFISDKISKKKQFDFSSHKFSNTIFYKLYDVLDESKVFNSLNTSPLQTNLKIFKIENSNPNSLKITSKKNKLYYFDDKIFVTLDNNLKKTFLITIDLIDYSSKVNIFDQVNINCRDVSRVKSNSYLYKDNLYQIKGCKNELSFVVKNFKTDSLIKEYRVKEHEEIKFRNTPLIQEGGMTVFTHNSEKELDKTKQVLRKISASDIGITVSQYQDFLELIIGGYKEVKGSSGGFGSVMPVPDESIFSKYGRIEMPLTYHYNPVMYSFFTYINTRSVYFKSLLDYKNFNHIDGSVSKNAYDKIKDFEDEINTVMSSLTIFKVDDYYVFGYYNKKEKKYYLRKFTY